MKKCESPIFIVGLPRSGSTLWLNILANNNNIFRLGEMLFLTPWRKDFRWFLNRMVGDLSNEENIQKMIDLFFQKETVGGLTASFWKYDIKTANTLKFREKFYERISLSDRTIESIFKTLIEELTFYSGKERCCVKFPVYMNHISDLLRWYPKCKIVHITRDPRAISLSKTNDPGGTEKKIEKYPSLGCILKKTQIIFVLIQYYWSSKIHIKYSACKNYSLFKYENLLVDPEKTIKELCAFAEIDFTNTMLVPQRGNEKGQKSSLTGKRQQGFDKKAATRWMDVISVFDKFVITILMKTSMKRFGYFE